MRSYTQLTQEQRYQIYVLMKAGHTQSEIADLLGVHKSTISRELRRNSGRKGYRPQQANRFCLQRRGQKAAPRIAPSTWALVERLLREEWSPEQISGWWLLSEYNICLSIEWIYQYTLSDKQSGGSLFKYLRCQKQRKKRYGVYSYQGQIPGQISIEQRPAIVDRRSRYGDWELDTVIGKNQQQALSTAKNGMITTLVERKSRLTLMAKVIRKTAENVSDAIVRLLSTLKPWVHTLTSDNGREFAQHARIAKKLNANFYFAHPYASWERVLNENTNGLIRQYFPKKHDFTTITDQQVAHVMDNTATAPENALALKHRIRYFSGSTHLLH